MRYLVALILILALVGCSSPTPRVCIDDACLKVEIADTPAKQQAGLQNRTLEKGTGMLFVFDKPGAYRFWMHNTKIPLDIIWVNENGFVIYIAENLLPCEKTCDSYGPVGSAMYVLEANSGFVKDNGITLGKSMKYYDVWG